MKPLATKFRSNGFEFNQVMRAGNVALFAKTKPSIRSINYEVIIVQSHNGYEIAGKTFEPAETYPPSESWGRLGWSFMDQESAKGKFDEISSEINCHSF